MLPLWFFICKYHHKQSTCCQQEHDTTQTHVRDARVWPFLDTDCVAPTCSHIWWLRSWNWQWPVLNGLSIKELLPCCSKTWICVSKIHFLFFLWIKSGNVDIGKFSSSGLRHKVSCLPLGIEEMVGQLHVNKCQALFGPIVDPSRNNSRYKRCHPNILERASLKLTN